MSVLLMLSGLLSQSTAPPPATVRVVLLIPSDGRGIVAAQNWGRWFDDAGYRMSTKRPVPGAKAGIEETSRGRLRTVTVTFALGKDGSIGVDDRKFAAGGSQQLATWLKELESYGAAGRPNGQPQWGLGKDALAAVETAAASEAIPGQTIGQLAGGLADRFDASVLLSDDVAASTPLPAAPPLACGTAAAWQLEAAGCCWFPERQPNGAIQLRIVRSGSVLKPWPVGWIVPRPIRTDLVVPRLFATAEYPKTATSLDELVDFVESNTKTAILPQLGALKTRPNWGSEPVFVSSATARPYPTLRKLLAKRGLTKQVRLDDGGAGFVVFMPFVPGMTTPMTISPRVPSRVRSRLESFAATP